MCKNKKSQKLHNKTALILLIGLLFTGGLIGCSDKSAPTDASPVSEVESKISIVSKEPSTESNTSPKASESQSEIESNNLESSITSEITTEPESELELSIASETTIESESEILSTEVEHRTGAEIIGISEKDISDISLTYYDKVKNDVTGNWRLAVISEDIDIQDYIFSYYKKYYKNDNEIHGIVNPYKKITARIDYLYGMLFVTELTYVDGEEHDAKLLYSGTPIKGYLIYTDNGDIVKAEAE